MIFQKAKSKQIYLMISTEVFIVANLHILYQQKIVTMKKARKQKFIIITYLFRWFRIKY